MKRFLKAFFVLTLSLSLVTNYAQAADFETADNALDKATDWAATVGKPESEKNSILAERRARRAAKRFEKAIKAQSKAAGKEMEKMGKEMKKAFSVN